MTTVIVSPSLTAMPGRLLAAVLERVEPEVGQVGDRLVRGVHAEHATRVRETDRSLLEYRTSRAPVGTQERPR